MSASNDAVWYIMRDGQRVGPFSADDFARFEEAGRLRPTDQVWHTGLGAWIAYSDYDAHKAAARFAGSHRPSSSANADHERCAICLLMRRGVDVLTLALRNAFRLISKQLANIRAIAAPSPAANAQPVNAAEDAPGGKTRPSADPFPTSLHPLPSGAQEPNLRQLARGPVVQRPADRVIGHGHDPEHDSSAPESPNEDVAGTLRPSPSIARLATESQAAAHIGLELATFRAWVADGRLPRALPDCGKYDMKAIHIALDRMSGILPRESGSNHWLERISRGKSI